MGRRQPGISILLLEKEPELALHQTGRNSGVIHSGIYYKPGSFKAKFAREGSRTMVEFCQQHGIDHDICGKVIVATDQRELPLLEKLFQRGLENGLNVSRLSADQVKEIEPHVRCLAAIKVPTTGIVNYRSVALKYADLIKEQARIAAEREISTFTEAAADARREHQRANEAAEKARSELRSLLMTHIALLERTPPQSNGETPQGAGETAQAPESSEADLSDTNRITVY